MKNIPRGAVIGAAVAVMLTAVIAYATTSSKTVYPKSPVLQSRSETFMNVSAGAQRNKHSKVSPNVASVPIASTTWTDFTYPAGLSFANGEVTQPVVPVRLRLKAYEASGSSLAQSIVIEGLNARGDYVSEAFTFSSNSTATTNHAYASIVKIRNTGGTANQTNDKLKIQTSTHVGLSARITTDSSNIQLCDVYKMAVDTINIAANGRWPGNQLCAYVTVGAGGVYSTVMLPYRPNGSKDYTIWYADRNP